MISSDDSKLESSVIAENCHLILIIESEMCPFILFNRTVVFDEKFRVFSEIFLNLNLGNLASLMLFNVDASM